MPSTCPWTIYRDNAPRRCCPRRTRPPFESKRPRQKKSLRCIRRPTAWRLASTRALQEERSHPGMSRPKMSAPSTCEATQASSSPITHGSRPTDPQKVECNDTRTTNFRNATAVLNDFKHPTRSCTPRRKMPQTSFALGWEKPTKKCSKPMRLSFQFCTMIIDLTKMLQTTSQHVDGCPTTHMKRRR